MYFIIWFLEVLVFSYFLYVALYTFIFGVAGVTYRAKHVDKAIVEKSTFGVFIPAYKEDGVIIEVAKQALKQYYPLDKYKIIVIADSLKKETVTALKKLPIELLEVSFDKSTKVKALNTAFKEFRGRFDYAVILDADNVMEPAFLNTMNHLHQQGFAAIQGRRAAKNKQNSLAFLDGLSEEINNHFLGKGSTALKLSSSLKGSGMSFNFDLVMRLMSKMNSIGGFDRELEVKLVQQGYRVLYADNAIVYDEKVAKKEVFENQRKRWISSQYVYLRKYFSAGVKQLFAKADFAFFNSAVLRNIQLPRLLNLGLMFLVATISTVLNHYLVIHYGWWLLLLFTMYLGVFLAIPREYMGKELLLAIMRLPALFFSMLKVTLRLKGSNKEFIHTPHGTN